MSDLQQFQSGIEYYIYLIIGIVISTLFTHCMSTAIKGGKLGIFLMHLIIGLLFFFASSSPTICTYLGSALGTTQLTAFLLLSLFGCMSIANSLIIVFFELRLHKSK